MQKGPNPYLIMRENEYLTAVVERVTGSGIREPVFSIYRYDAARIQRLEQAKEVARRLGKAGETWKAVQFNPLRGGERLEWTGII